ncbi:MAG: hypothetical protein KF824_01745 [Fimbriimonadaceae bacterium]|nr:MAG: hypothetical protein KF824_01745 [Fimbriimonadaceae bacterium]
MILFMWTRRLPYICAALTPALLLVVLAINGRYFVSPWSTPEYGQEASNDIAAYVPMVRFTYINSNAINRLHEETIEELRDKWFRQEKAGKLHCFEPISASDDGSSGARQEIELSRRTLLNGLIRLALRKSETGDYESASEYLRNVIEISNISKFNSALSITGSASMQCEAIRRYEEIKPHVSESSQRKFINAIILMTVDPERVQQYAAKFAALSQTKNSLEEIQLPKASEVKQLISNNAALNHAEFDTPEANLFMQSLRVAYDLEIRLDETKNRYRMTATKNQSESESILHPRASSG